MQARAIAAFAGPDRWMKPAQGASGSAPGTRPVNEGMLLAGRYRLAERLRERDGSTEWRAADEALARPVAVRVFAPGFPRLPEVMAAVRAASRISDPRLARIYDADDRADPPFIVTGWPSGACLADLLGDGPLDPWRAARVIAEAADALAAVHEAGLAHLCLGPDSLWCGPGGEVTVTGLGTAAALTGARAADPALADTRGLARLLYAALTGYWPGEGQAALPPAPRTGGRMRRPGLLRPGIPAGIDSVTCRALSAQASEGAPPILGPAQLAMELAEVIRLGRSGPSPGRLPIPAQPASRAPTLPDSTASLRPPGSRTARRLIRLTAVIVLAVLAGGGWLAVRGLTAQHRPSAEAGARPSAAVQTLAPVSATAFGPLGESDGDNPQLARLALGGNPAAAWHTHWYTTAGFGNLKPGTGLLLDMGRPVTITSAQITLGPITGADVQLRAGSEAAPTDLRPVARAADAGGVVTLRPSSPAKGRYLLIWFTRLPPDASGTFEAVVYGVRLHGTALDAARWRTCPVSSHHVLVRHENDGHRMRREPGMNS